MVLLLRQAGTRRSSVTRGLLPGKRDHHDMGSAAPASKRQPSLLRYSSNAIVSFPPISDIPKRADLPTGEGSEREYSEVTPGHRPFRKGRSVGAPKA